MGTGRGRRKISPRLSEQRPRASITNRLKARRRERRRERLRTKSLPGPGVRIAPIADDRWNVLAFDPLRASGLYRMTEQCG